MPDIFVSGLIQTRIDHIPACRGGETETQDKMRARIQYDIDTMRNGSRGFDCASTYPVG